MGGINNKTSNDRRKRGADEAGKVLDTAHRRSHARSNCDVDQAPAGCSGKVNTEQCHANQQNRRHGCCRLWYDQRKGGRTEHPGNNADLTAFNRSHSPFDQPVGNVTVDQHPGSPKQERDSRHQPCAF